MPNSSELEKEVKLAHLLAELKKLNRVLLLSNGSRLESELERFATTASRKKVWVLMDGKTDINAMIGPSGLARSKVYGFIGMLEGAGLAEKRHGQPPTRAIEFVPASWAELLHQDPGVTLDSPVSETTAEAPKVTQAEINQNE